MATAKARATATAMVTARVVRKTTTPMPNLTVLPVTGTALLTVPRPNVNTQTPMPPSIEALSEIPTATLLTGKMLLIMKYLRFLDPLFHLPTLTPLLTHLPIAQ